MRYTQIKGLSQVRRLPRLGKIRLGVKVKSPKTGNEYPKETPHFVVPPEIVKLYGETPTELDVMIPVEDQGVSFPQAYMYYGSSRGLKCSGDGETAMRTLQFQKELNNEKTDNGDTKELIQVECTCPLFDQGKCKQVGYLQVMLPKVSVGGVYSIVTSSYNSIVDLNSGIDYVRAMVGRVAMVPLKLKREPRETHHDGKKQTHYTMRLELEGNVDFINALRDNTNRILSGPAYALPAPQIDNPEFDEGATVVEEPPEPDAPEQSKESTPPDKPTKEQLIQFMAAAASFDEVNEILDMARSLPNGERGEVLAASAKRTKALREQTK